MDPLNSVKELQYVPQPLPMNSAGQIAKTALHLVQDDVNNYIWTISWSDLFAYQVTTGGLLKQVDTSTFLPQYNKALKRIIKDRDGNLWVTSLDNHNFIIYFDEDNLHEYNIAPLEKQIKWTPILKICVRMRKEYFGFSKGVSDFVFINRRKIKSNVIPVRKQSVTVHFWYFLIC